MADHEFQAWREEWSALVDAFLATDVGLRLILELESFEKPMFLEMLRAYPDLILQDSLSEVARSLCEDRCGSRRGETFRDVSLALTEMYRAIARSENGAKTRAAWLQTRAAQAATQIQQGWQAALAAKQPTGSGQSGSGESRIFETTDQIEAFYRRFDADEIQVTLDDAEGGDRKTERVRWDIQTALIAASIAPTPIVDAPPTVVPGKSDQLDKRLNSGDASLMDLLTAYCSDTGEPLSPVQPTDVYISRYPASPPPALASSGEVLSPKAIPAESPDQAEDHPFCTDEVTTVRPPDPVFSEEAPEVSTGEIAVDPEQLAEWDDAELDLAFEDLRLPGDPPSSKDGSS